MPPSHLSLRQRMAWLHTWCGLVGAWLLCMIFLAGTLSVFREPITRWMSAEPPLPALTQPLTQPEALAPAAAHPHTSDAALTAAWQWLETRAPEASFWRLELPVHADQSLRVFWRASGAGRSTEEAALDPRDGTELPQPWGRRTEGGRHFMVLHYTLHAGTAGFWLVGGLSMAMLVLLISGVVVHKRIFADFFTFRPGKGLRSWLDAHNATGVLTLPFQLMIVYSGLAIFYTTYMPGALWGAYGTDPGAQTALAAKQAAPGVATDTRGGTPVSGATLPALLTEAYPTLGAPVHRIVVTRPGTEQAQIRVLGQAPDSSLSRQLRNNPGNVLFSGATGAQLSAPRSAESTGSTSAHAVLQHLHLATYGGWTLKWLYFVLGLAGTAMIATGSLLFSIKRRQKLDPAFGSAGARAHQLIEGIHVAVIAGAALACIGYLVINRLLPADAPDRIQREITLFFLVWLASLGHALLRPYRQAWVEQLGATALLCLLLPALNLITTGQWLFSYLAKGNLESAMVELTVLALGSVLAWTTWRVQQKNATARAMPRPSHLPGPSARQRWQTLAQVMAAVVGGYAVVLLGTYVLGQLWVQLMAASGVSAVVVLTLSSFVVYAGVATWAMTRPSAWRAWRGLTTVGLSLGLLALVLGQAT